ncbi:MAG: DUF4173 domain-containing protein [Bacteroidetes bacterium]|nr:DUF4173 domain-containing protein [Bacteroidota bacterium]
MKKRIQLLIALACAILFTCLFFDSGIGVNLAIFYTLFAATLLTVYGWQKRKPVFWIFFVASLLLSWAVAWHGNYFTIFVFFIQVAFFAGAFALSELGVGIPFFKEGIVQLFVSQGNFVSGITLGRGERRRGTPWKYIFQYGIPALVVFVLFIFFYRNSNSIFNSYVDEVSVFFENIMDKLNLKMIGTFLLGLALVNVFLFHIVRKKIVDQWLSKIPFIERIRDKRIRFMKRRGLNTKLGFENKFGIFFIGLLNAMLLILNISDLQLVWFGFEWKGQLLREYVHEGTWYLIISICISAITILYFFRGNLNFFSGNKYLKIMARIWMLQNAFLAISVLLRNLRYIEFYGLAYLRIGVFFFLVAVVALLVFVWLKIGRRESMWLFLSRNLITGMILLGICALVDWSNVITRFNLSHYKKSFVHMQFLAKMPDRCLPVLLKYRELLPEIKSAQLKRGYGYSDEVNEEEISVVLERRKLEFIRKYDQQSWRETTWADRDARYRMP